MIRGRSVATIAVRNPTGNIVRRSLPIQGWSTGRATGFPMVRGVIALFETVVIGMRALALSAQIATPSDDENEEPISGWATGIMMAIAFLVAIVVFFLAPLFISRGVESVGTSAVVANVSEGLIRLGLFIGYVWLVGQMRDIDRVFGYHGAEHMIVSAQEKGLSLDVQAARTQSTAHPRCGTAFLLTVVLVSILVFIVVPREPMWLLVGSRIFLIPVIAAISYEFIRFSGRHQSNFLVRNLNSPSMLLQKMTTRQPDDGQIEVAIEALQYAQELDSQEGLESSCSGTH